MCSMMLKLFLKLIELVGTQGLPEKLGVSCDVSLAIFLGEKPKCLIMLRYD